MIEISDVDVRGTGWAVAGGLIVATTLKAGAWITSRWSHWAYLREARYYEDLATECQKTLDKLDVLRKNGDRNWDSGEPSRNKVIKLHRTLFESNHRIELIIEDSTSLSRHGGRNGLEILKQENLTFRRNFGDTYTSKRSGFNALYGALAYSGDWYFSRLLKTMPHWLFRMLRIHKLERKRL